MTLDNRQKLFNEIAPYYDFFNNIISLGMHHLVKYQSVKLLKPKGFGYDLCCGTGDISAILKKNNVNVVGVDFSEQMLNIAQNKHKNIDFYNCNCEQLPFNNESANFCTITFGLRNIVNREKTITEIYRLLKENGELMYLDFSNNKNFIDKIFNKILLILGNEKYKYLAKSKAEFWNVDELEENFKNHGFKVKRKKYFIFGTLVAIIFQK